MSEKFTRDREATCAWDCTLDAGHDGPCGKKAAMTPADPARPQKPEPTIEPCWGQCGIVALKAELESLSARLQQVEQERDKLKEKAKWFEAHSRMMAQAADTEKSEARYWKEAKEAAEAALASAREQIAQLERYVEHRPGCIFSPLVMTSTREKVCTCGLASVRSGASAPDSTK